MSRKSLAGLIGSTLILTTLACQFLSGGGPTNNQTTATQLAAQVATDTPSAAQTEVESPQSTATRVNIVATKASNDAQATEQAQQLAAAQATEDYENMLAETLAVGAVATVEASYMYSIVDELRSDGIIDGSGGAYFPVDDFEESWAQLGWYQWWNTGYAPSDFVLSASTEWESGSRYADWWNSGCGFVFRENGDDDHYMIYLALDGYVYMKGYVDGKFKEMGREYFGKIDYMNGSADIILAAEGNTITYYVDGKRVFQRKVDFLSDGNLGLTLVSGTNKDFGTRCRISNIELWDLNAEAGAYTPTGDEDGIDWPVVISDSFNNNLSDWPSGNDNNDYASITRGISGSYEWSVDAKQAVNARAFPGDMDDLTDFSATVNAVRISGPQEAAYGLIFRRQDEDNLYFFAVIDTGSYYVAALVDNNWELLIAPEETDTILPGANLLGVLALGSDFYFYINGEEVGSVTDSRLSSGTIGLATDLASADLLKMEFDNFEVLAP